MENTLTSIKSAIIGKAWNNSKDENQLIPAGYTLTEDQVFHAGDTFILNDLTIKIDRNLPFPIKIAKGERLFFYPNNKREDHRDADISISVVKPMAEAIKIIEGTKSGVKAWRERNK